MAEQRAPSTGVVRFQRPALIIGILGLAASAIGWFINPQEFFRGYLPSYVLDSAKKLTPSPVVFVEVEPISGVTIDPRDARTEVGHLEGWGRGLYNEYIFYQRSIGTVSRRSVSIPVKGRGKLRVRVKGLRVGDLVKDVAVE